MKKKTNEKPIFLQKGILGTFDTICCCINSTVGLGVLKIGAEFTSGLLVAFILLFIICFLSFYSFKLFILSASACQESTMEEIWGKIFSKKTVFIPVFISVLSTLLSMITYMKEIQASTIKIFRKITILLTEDQENIFSTFEAYKMLIGCFVFVFFLIPVCIMKHLKTMAIFSFVSICFFILFIIYMAVIFGYEVKKVGFDPNNSFRVVQLKGTLPKSLSTAIFAFNFYPLTYPGLRHVKNSTKSHLLTIIGMSMIAILISYIIVGLFSYLSYFDKNKIGVVLDYIPENSNSEKIMAIIGHIISLGFILLTIPFRLNACRFVILNTINDSSSFPADIWTFLGIIISLLALVLGNLTEKYLNILFIFSDVMASFLLFMFSPLFYLKTNGVRDNLFNVIMSVLFLIIGVITTVFMVLYDGFF